MSLTDRCQNCRHAAMYHAQHGTGRCELTTCPCEGFKADTIENVEMSPENVLAGVEAILKGSNQTTN